ncbi:TetR/AcrR family transcriptional regulator [Bradyrhizobium sp. Tv2a-2]|uniref:TetR/AcrR family transcriptional regulator n=1 Tax=Bradyrhizobium sp. Tv2a-2 TaxID=113395 RepID=UPI000463065B|nr:TetR/AcrR family transcriptional regulator [Bradyrhizobium sp. Tv2a-2]
MAVKQVVKSRADEAGDVPVRQRILEAAFSAFMEQGFAETSTLEIATRAKASKRELYTHFGSKQQILAACIAERAKRFHLPGDVPEPRDREMLALALTAFGSNLLREISDPTVIAVFRLAITEAVRAPDVARALSDIGIAASRTALRELMTHARATALLDGEPIEMAEHFAGLLWGTLMTHLLLGVSDRPSPREITRRAEAATAALLRLYASPAPAD